MSQFVFPPVTTTITSEQSNGGALPSTQMVVAGYDGSLTRVLLTDSGGRLEINAIVSLPLPSGAATSALQTAGNTLLGTIDADTSALFNCVDAGGSQMQVDIVADGAGLATSALQGSANTLLTTISTKDFATQTTLATLATQATLATIDADTSALFNCVDAGGSQMQVDVVAPLPSGTNTIGAVTVASVAPVDFLDSGVIDTSTASIATGGTTVVSSLAADCTQIEIQEDIGEYMSLRVGGVVKSYLPLGGGKVKVNLSTGNTVQLYSEIGTAIASGKIAINFLG